MLQVRKLCPACGEYTECEEYDRYCSHCGGDTLDYYCLVCHKYHYGWLQGHRELLYRMANERITMKLIVDEDEV